MNLLNLKKRIKKLFYYNSNTHLFNEYDVISEYVLNNGNLEEIDLKLLKKCFFICYEAFNTQDVSLECLDNTSSLKEYEKDSYRQCKKCYDILNRWEFTTYIRKSDNKKIDYPYCKSCVRKINKKRNENPFYAEKMKNKSAEYRKKPDYQNKHREYKKKWYNEKKSNPEFRNKINEYQKSYRLRKKQNVC